jgi:hypothetical protein
MPTHRTTSTGPGDAAPDEASELAGGAPDMAEIEATGRVERRLLAAGSKSEHQGEVLLGDDGTMWTLRRQGGPAFGDTVLAALAGRRIRARGRLRGALLILRAWDVLD